MHITGNFRPRSASRNRNRSRNRSRNRMIRQQTQAVAQAQSQELAVVESSLPPQEMVVMNSALDDIIPEGFLVQLAHGSKTITIGGVSSVRQMYEQIATHFDEITVDDILFLTIGTYKVDMDSILAGDILFGDMIFVHVKGAKVEVEMTKSDKAIGITISDNGNGKSYVKRIRAGSIAESAKPALDVGMHIEKINETSMLGKRHFEVARVLREIPVGSTFKLRLIEPLKSGFSMLQPRGGGAAASAKPKSIENGGKTLRFKSNGTAVVQEEQPTAEGPSAEVITAINNIFEEYLGFSDEDLSRAVCEVASTCKNPHEMATKLRESEISQFGFPDELVYDMYGLYSDIKSNRALRVAGANEK